MAKLLVVDDEEMIRVNLECFLEDEGYDIISADSGEGALELLKSEDDAPDLGVIDMRLPGIDGNETILGAHSIFPQMKFIIHTGSSEYSLPDELTHIGLSNENILLKPLPDMQTMLDTIERILESTA